MQRDPEHMKDFGEARAELIPGGPPPAKVKLYPRNFDACPVCGTKSGFTMECKKEDFSIEELARGNPYLAAIKQTYNKGLFQYTLIVLTDTCAGCGVMYTVARDKKENPAFGYTVR